MSETQTTAHEAADRHLQRTGKMVFLRHVSRLRHLVASGDVNSRYKKYTEIKKSFKFRLLHAVQEDKEITVKIKEIRGKDASMLADFHETYIVNHIGAHPNIVETKRMFMLGKEHVCMEMDRCWGDLEDYVLDRRIAKDGVLRIMHQIALALKHLKSRCVVHCDIKPTNVLLTKSFVDGSPDGLVKLCDFELSREISRPGALHEPSYAVNAVVSRPPEILLLMQFDYAVDIFAFGVLVCFLLNAYAGFAPNRLYDPFLVQAKDADDMQLQMNHLDVIVGPIPVHMFIERDNIYRNFPGFFETAGVVGLPPAFPAKRGFNAHFAHFVHSTDKFLASVAPVMQMMLYPEPRKRILVETLLIDPIFEHVSQCK